MKTFLAIVGFVFLALLVGTCAACGDDDERALSASHRYECMNHECGGDDWGGGSDGNTGYDGEGGRSGDTDQRGDHNCRNFCFYGIPAPGGEGG